MQNPCPGPQTPVGRCRVASPLVVAQNLLQFDSETRWIRSANTHPRTMLPTLPGQAGFNKAFERPVL